MACPASCNALWTITSFLFTQPFPWVKVLQSLEVNVTCVSLEGHRFTESHSCCDFFHSMHDAALGRFVFPLSFLAAVDNVPYAAIVWAKLKDFTADLTPGHVLSNLRSFFFFQGALMAATAAFSLSHRIILLRFFFFFSSIAEAWVLFIKASLWWDCWSFPLTLHCLCRHSAKLCVFQFSTWRH